VKLPHLDTWGEGRRKNAVRYREGLAARGLDRVLGLPVEPWSDTGTENHHIYNQFIIRSTKRDALKKHLNDSGIGSEIYYPLPLHMQECFRDLGYREGDFPESERASRESLALPIYPELARGQVDYVIAKIAEFHA
jgi:dTDP-4-amino-4,6-dideoxygalactose transaminase